MPGAETIRAGRAFIELFVDQSRLTRDLRSVRARLSAFSAQLQSIGLRAFGAGAGLAAPLMLAVRSFRGSAGAIADMSARTGLSIEALGELGYATAATGTTLEQLEHGLRRLSVAIGDAAAGSAESARLLAELGLSAEQLLGLGVEEQLYTVADALASITTPALQARSALRLLGRESGAQLLPLLQRGAAGIAALRAEGANLGVTITRDDVSAALQLRRAWAQVRYVFDAVTDAVGRALAPALSSLMAILAPHIGSMKRWLDRHRGLIVAIGLSAAALAAFGAALFTVSAAMRMATMTTHILTGAWQLLTTTVATAKAVFFGVGTAISGMGLTLAVVLGAISAGLFVWAKFSVKGQEAARKFRTAMASIVSDSRSAMRAAGDALARGDLVSAAKIVGAWLRYEFMRMWTGVKLANIRAVFGLAAIITCAVNNIKLSFAAFHHWLRMKWIDLTDSLGSLWDSMGLRVRRAWLNIKHDIGTGWRKLRGIFDFTFDVEAAQREADIKLTEALRGLEEERQKRAEEAQKQSLEERLAEQRRYSERIIAINQDYVERMKQLAKVQESKEKALEAELERLRKEFEKKLKQLTPAETPSGAPQLPREVPPAAERFVPPVPARPDVYGTFNPAVLNRIGFGRSLFERIVEAVEETAKHTGRMTMLLDQFNPIFE